MDSLVQSSRVFQELAFSGEIDILLDPGKFQMIEEYLVFTGPQIKKLYMEGVRVNPKILQKLLDFLPNLEFVELDYTKADPSSQSTKWHLKSPKISRIKMHSCFPPILNFLESLEKCAIKEADLSFWSDQEDPEITKKFLKAQEKKLKICTAFELPGELKDLPLESLEYENGERRQVSLNFLEQQVDLKFLELRIKRYTTEHFNLICKLKNLESLKLFIIPGCHRLRDSSGLNNLHKLQKLKSLTIFQDISSNILDHLKFGVFLDFEELEAYFCDATLEAIQEMKRISPNLKKIRVLSYTSSAKINAMLESLEHLESMFVRSKTWEIPTDKVYPKMKFLHIEYRSNYKFILENLMKMLPNLETLNLDYGPFEVTGSFLITLLSGLKQLKRLSLRTCDLKVDAEVALRCIRVYGGNLEDFWVNAGVVKEPYKIVDGYKDFVKVMENPGRQISIKKML
jgi:hypothetical protein